MELLNIVTLKAINKSYNKGKNVILQDINLDIIDKPNVGQFAVLMGKSGCGKSTILRLISGLSKPTSGEIFLYGKPKTDEDRVNMIFQKYSSFYWMSVLRNVGFFLEKNGVPEKERNERAMEMIKIVDLEGKENEFASDKVLSGGQLQRVAIARSLIADPNLLLLDEPFGALDSQSRLRMQNKVRSIVNKMDSTMILVTHDLTEAVYLADDIFIMSSNPGKITTHIKINLGEERDASIKRSPEFIKDVAHLEEIMNSL